MKSNVMYRSVWSWEHLGFVRHTHGKLKRVERMVSSVRDDGSKVYVDVNQYEKAIERVPFVQGLKDLLKLR